MAWLTGGREGTWDIPSWWIWQSSEQGGMVRALPSKQPWQQTHAAAGAQARMVGKGGEAHYVRTTSAEGFSGKGLRRDAQNMSQAKAREW